MTIFTRASRLAALDSLHSARMVVLDGALAPEVGPLRLSEPDLRGARFIDWPSDQLAHHARLVLVETVFDTLNAQAALFAIDSLSERVPVMVSGTITDASGRTLSGQTTEAFFNSIIHARPLSVGLNCALGAAQLRPYLQELAR